MQPIPPTLATELESVTARRPPASAMFTMPRSDVVVTMLRADLADARSIWIDEVPDDKEGERREESSFLTYRDESGRVADFHALRHTFITNLARGGVHPKQAQDLATFRRQLDTEPLQPYADGRTGGGVEEVARPDDPTRT